MQTFYALVFFIENYFKQIQQTRHARVHSGVHARTHSLSGYKPDRNTPSDL